MYIDSSCGVWTIHGWPWFMILNQCWSWTHAFVVYMFLASSTATKRVGKQEPGLTMISDIPTIIVDHMNHNSVFWRISRTNQHQPLCSMIMKFLADKGLVILKCKIWIIKISRPLNNLTKGWFTISRRSVPVHQFNLRWLLVRPTCRFVHLYHQIIVDNMLTIIHPYQLLILTM